VFGWTGEERCLEFSLNTSFWLLLIPEVNIVLSRGSTEISASGIIAVTVMALIATCSLARSNIYK